MKKKHRNKTYSNAKFSGFSAARTQKSCFFFGGMDRSHFQEVKPGNRLRGIRSPLIMRFITILYLDQFGCWLQVKEIYVLDLWGLADPHRSLDPTGWQKLLFVTCYNKLG